MLIVTPKRMARSSVHGRRSGVVNGVRPSGMLWPDMENLLAWYRGDIVDGKLQAYRPIANHATQQVKSSGFLGAGSSPCPGLLATDTITASGPSDPTCSVNGTLTFPGPDCWDIDVFRDGVRWASWKGINAGKDAELDASGNGHHLIGIVGTTITERVDGSGTNYANEMGFTVADGTQYLDEFGDILIELGWRIPVLLDGSGSASWSYAQGEAVSPSVLLAWYVGGVIGGELIATIGDNLVVVSGTTYPDIVVYAPTGHSLSSVSLWADEAHVDLRSLYYNTGKQTFIFDGGMLVYDSPVSDATESRLIDQFYSGGVSFDPHDIWDSSAVVLNNFTELDGVYTCTTATLQKVAIPALLTTSASYRTSFNVVNYISNSVGVSSVTTTNPDKYKNAVGTYQLDFIANGTIPTEMRFTTDKAGNSLSVNYVRKQISDIEFVDFEVPDGFTNTGLTYDPNDDCLWSADFSNKVWKLSKYGNKLAVFTIGAVGAGLQGVAYDTSDDTIWTSSGAALRRYSKSGELLQTITKTGLNISSSLAYIASDDTLLYGVISSNLIRKIRCSDGLHLETITIAGATDSGGTDGCAYNPDDNTLWITQNGTQSIIHANMDGSTIAVYDNPAPGGQGEGICIDTSLNILWYSADDEYHSAVPDGNRIYPLRLLSGEASA